MPGTLQAYDRVADLRPHQRLPAALVQGHRQPRQQGRVAGAIDTPEVDQELSQARANREQIVAALDLAKIKADRWANLRKTDSVSQQEADQQAAAISRP